MPKFIENKVQSIQDKISAQCEMVAKSFNKLSIYFKELEKSTKNSENMNLRNKILKRNKSLDIIKKKKNVVNYIGKKKLNNRGRKPKKNSLMKISTSKKIKIGDLNKIKKKPNSNEKKEKSKSILINSSESSINENINPIQKLKKIKTNNSKEKKLLKLKRKRTNKKEKNKEKENIITKRPYNKNPLKGIGYGRILKLNCYENGKPIIGYKIQIKFYKSNYSLGPFSDELFALNLKNKLVDEFAELKCCKDNYEDKAKKAISEIEKVIYKEHNKLSQSKSKSLFVKKGKKNEDEKDKKNEDSESKNKLIENKNEDKNINDDSFKKDDGNKLIKKINIIQKVDELKNEGENIEKKDEEVLKEK